MHAPPHPGEVLKDRVFANTGVTVTDAAKTLRVTRADMALRLAQWLNTDPEVWINMQAAYDLWQTKQKLRPKIKPLHRAA